MFMSNFNLTISISFSLSNETKEASLEVFIPEDFILKI